MEKAILVGINIGNEAIPFTYQMEELKNLALASDIEVLSVITQNMDKPTSAFYVGKGKVSEIKNAINALDATIVIFNDELSPAHIRNLEEALDTKVIDRSLLILDIFAKRAKTRESILEIELAQLRYMLPRLVGLSKSLSRQGGGFNAKGPGEKKIELDKRKILDDISALKKELDTIHISKETQRQRRVNSNIPTVALVGYTNAGKSSTMNSLISMFMGDNEKLVFEKDMLFATLGTHVRRIKLPTNEEFLLVDTVGFVSNLPHHLVNSFKSTLEEVKDADLILHVVDASNENYIEQINITNQVLNDLGATGIPTIYLFNKADKLEYQFFPTYNPSFLISNLTKQNLNLVVNEVKEMLFKDKKKVKMLIPYTDGNIVNSLRGKAHIHKIEYTDNGVFVCATINTQIFNIVKKFIIDK